MPILGSFFWTLNLVFWANKINSFRESLTMSKKFAILLLLTTTSLMLSGCGNTLEGAGRDLESWGKTLQETF